MKNVCNTLKIDNLGQYHYWYVQSDPALLADVSENFRDKCSDIDKLDPACFLSAPGLSRQSGLKMTGTYLMYVKQITFMDMLWVEKCLLITSNEEKIF